MFRTLAKILGALVLVVLATAAVVYLRGRNYAMHSLEADAATLGDTSDYDALALRLIAEMTFEEKVGQLYGETMLVGIPKFVAGFIGRRRFPHIYVGANERLGIPPWVLSDGPRGARVLAHGVEAVTTFPVAMARGATWDPDLEYRVHEVIAREMRANGTNYAATPCINLLRHPGWGRAQETYGEDPWLLGAMGVAAVRGLEDQRIMACPKHFALNSIENSRWVIDVEADARTLHEVYLPHFRRVVHQGRPASIMSAYNRVNGAFAGESRELLTDVLREAWGFSGFVSTDWGFGLYDAAKGVRAGLNVEMPFRNQYNVENLRAAIDAGQITEVMIDTLVRQSLRTRLPYAFVPERYRYGTEVILDPAHVALAREVAERSMVLLKNDGAVLPFRLSPKQTVAVIGRLADVANTGDQGSSDATPPYVITPYAGVAAFAKTIGAEVVLDDGSDLDRARDLARRADFVVLVAGYTYEDEGEYILLDRDRMQASADAGRLVGEKGEGGDRESLKLPPADEAMVGALVGANPNTVVALVAGSAVDMSDWLAGAPAVLYAWYAGMEGGNALARVVFGEVNPEGRLPFSIAASPASYPAFTPYANSTTYGYYHGYTLFDRERTAVTFPFGFGLSYTTFAYSDLEVQTPTLTATDSLRVSVRLTNTGARAGAEVAQLYIGFGAHAQDMPVKVLRDFEKVRLGPGETRVVSFGVSRGDLAWYNPQTRAWQVDAGTYEVYVGGSAAREGLLVAEFAVQ